MEDKEKVASSNAQKQQVETENNTNFAANKTRTRGWKLGQKREQSSDTAPSKAASKAKKTTLAANATAEKPKRGRPAKVKTEAAKAPAVTERTAVEKGKRGRPTKVKVEASEPAKAVQRSRKPSPSVNTLQTSSDKADSGSMPVIAPLSPIQPIEMPAAEGAAAEKKTSRGRPRKAKAETAQAKAPAKTTRGKSRQQTAEMPAAEGAAAEKKASRGRPRKAKAETNAPIEQPANAQTTSMATAEEQAAYQQLYIERMEEKIDKMERQILKIQKRLLKIKKRVKYMEK